MANQKESKVTPMSFQEEGEAALAAWGKTLTREQADNFSTTAGIMLSQAKYRQASFLARIVCESGFVEDRHIIGLAFCYFVQGEFTDTLEILKRTEPKSYEAMFYALRGESHFKLGHMGEAKPDLKAVLENEKPDNALYTNAYMMMSAVERAQSGQQVKKAGKLPSSSRAAKKRK